MNAGMGTIDAVSLSILWDRLIGITDEITSALVRSSFSTSASRRLSDSTSSASAASASSTSLATRAPSAAASCSFRSFCMVAALLKH